MAAWRDSLRQASFRGVPFFVEREGGGGGRNTVTHVYPLRDDPFVEDLGRAPRTFTVEGYVLGDNYKTAKDALITVLEQEGPGALVLHYSGERKVACTTFNYEESTDEGGMCRFSMSFTVTPTQPAQPATSTVSSTLVGTKATGLLGSISTAFSSAYSVLQEPQFAIDSLTQIATDATAAVDDAFAPIIDTAQNLATFKRSVEALAANINTLIRAPVALAAEVQLILGIAPTFGITPRETVLALIDIYDFQTTAEEPSPTTPTRTRELANQVALKALWRQTTIAEAASISVDVDFVSYDDAVDIRDKLLDRIDAESETATDDVYVPMQELRAALVAAVPGKDKDLARLVPVSSVTTIPSVVLAYQLYGDLDSELDLVARNNIRHPGFVPGGVTLQVLGRA